MHPRVNILQPGPGVGGHCISVDPWFLVGDYPNLSRLIHEARDINDSMPEFVLYRIEDIMQKLKMNNPTKVGFYGLTYKENVDDIRESPTLQLLERIRIHLGVPPKVYDPMIKKNILPNQYHDFKKFLEDIDLIVIMVAHDEIRENLEKLKGKAILDTRNICGLSGTYKL
jgi:UDP-N-acetyl-D-mannosaminuronic acid dehydrogenase